MKLRFLGTRGEIELRTARHHRQSALLVNHRGRALMIDCGLDWFAAAPAAPSTRPSRRSTCSRAGRSPNGG
jgi:hypothetical protein